MTVALGPPEGVQGNDFKLASGVLVRMADRFYIATASHYLDEVKVAEMTILFPPDEWAVVRDLEEAKELLEKEIDWRSKATRAQTINPKDVKRTDRVKDVALLEIDGARIPKWCRVYDLKKHAGQNQMPKLGEPTMVAGVPSQSALYQRQRAAQPGQSDEMHLARIAFEKFFDPVAVADPKFWPGEHGGQGFFPEYHFALFFDPYKVKIGIDPDGLSGGGLWRRNLVKTSGEHGIGIDMFDPILVGIQSSKHKDMIKATAVAELLALLDR
jgi:hypothetical protein